MKNLKKKLKNLLLRKLLNGVTENELLKNLSQGKVSSLAIEARNYIHKDSLFNTLKTEMDRVASIHIFRKSDNLDDIMFGKAMLYTNDLWEKKIKRLANERPDEAQRIGR